MKLAEKFLHRVPQYTRNARHLRSVLRHGTPRKLANLARAEAERKLRRVRVRSLPYLLIIDPCNYCNLRCPLCPTGMGKLGRPQAMLSFEHFRQCFDPLAPYLFEASLHNWGESLLNKEVYRMIAHAQENNVGTNLSTNLSAASRADLESILDSGLEYLIVSLDGTSRESYSQYRIRGNFDQVVANLAELLRLRKLRRSSTPVVEWQFIVMKQNEHEIVAAEEMAGRLGVDVLRFIPVGLPWDSTGEERRAYAEAWFPVTVRGRRHSPGAVEQQFGQADKPGPCFYLYRSMVVNPDSRVSPCCIVSGQDHDFGRLPAGDVRKLWNNDKYLSARSLFSREDAPRAVPTVCDGCDIFARRKTPRRPDGEARETVSSGLVQIR